MQEKLKHTPVLLHESIHGLNIKKDGIYIDCTFGYGGHSRYILSCLNDKGQLLGIDRDPKSINIANTYIRDPRFSIIYGKFSELLKYVEQRNLRGKINGIILDCGVSSLQIDDAERGFSFMKDGPLDMRMDPTKGESAAEWLFRAKEKDILFVLQKYGEERFAKRIAKVIVERNRKQPITRTKELADLIAAVISTRNKYKNKHPATRSFQAIRIWINKELDELNKVLKSIISVLSPGGRFVVICFHSLEDRLVKHFIRNHSSNFQFLAKIPMTETQIKILGNLNLKNLGKLIPSKMEIQENPRARSAIMRIAEKI